MNLIELAMKAVSAVRPDVAEKAQKELRKYSLDQAGLRKAVESYGGEAFLNKAVDFANSAPRVKRIFNQFGVKPEQLKDNVIKQLNSGAPSEPVKGFEDNSKSYKDRLSKLK